MGTRSPSYRPVGTPPAAVVALMLLLWASATWAMASRRTDHEHLHTGDARIDSIVADINERVEAMRSDGIGRLALRIYVQGTSTCHHRGRYTHHLSSLLPFESDTTHTTVVEALCDASYQYPCPLQFNPIAISTNARKRGRRLLKEAYRTMLPFYSMRRTGGRGNSSTYVLPFTDDGLAQYTYTAHGSIDNCYRVDFTPRRDHHTLISGYALLDTLSGDIRQLTVLGGRIDFGRTTFTVRFGSNPQMGHFMPESSDISIHYRVGDTRATNHYVVHYQCDELTPKAELDRRHLPLDVTPVYQTDTLQHLNFDSIRPIGLPSDVAQLLAAPTVYAARNRHKLLYRQLPERLFGSTDINAFGTRLRVYGPLNPAALGYDHRDGISLRERLRWSHIFANHQSLLMRLDLGWCFGVGEGRYRVDLEWMHHPERRSGLRIVARNRNSGFSSKFRNLVNEGLRRMDSTHVDFSQLGIDYFHHHENKVEHAWELRTGLMLYAGVSYSYRDIVRRGHYAIDSEHLGELLHRHYSDFSPYYRVQWTPHQYYRMQGRQKLYMASRYPTFTLETVRSIPGVFNSSSNYGRVEVDMQQRIAIGDRRALSYHLSGGQFFRQEGEYFIGWSYFSRSQFPSSWEDHIGGTFALLDEYWYSSTPGYVQAHVMYESPFLLLHLARPISKYVITERIYLSNLWGDGKNGYTEVGYGMGNNYFNVGAFCGFIGLFQDAEIGFRATLAIDSHL